MFGLSKRELKKFRDRLADVYLSKKLRKSTPGPGSTAALSSAHTALALSTLAGIRFSQVYGGNV